MSFRCRSTPLNVRTSTKQSSDSDYGIDLIPQRLTPNKSALLDAEMYIYHYSTGCVNSTHSLSPYPMLGPPGGTTSTTEVAESPMQAESTYESV